MQLLLFLFAMILGLTYSYNTDGLPFVPAICLFAGIFMIMPTLFNFTLGDFKLAREHKLVIAKNLLVNFVILPLIAIGIGLLIGDYGIAAGIFLLSLLAGGGMVMHWIKKSGGDTHMGFILLFINLALLSLSLAMFHLYGSYVAPLFDIAYEQEQNSSHFVRAALMLLIVIPFIVSRLLLKFVPAIVEGMTQHRQTISTMSIVFIIFYLFALQSSKQLFDIELMLVFKAFIGVILFYLAAMIVAKVVFDTQKKEERAASWHVVTRYITLALIVSTFSTMTYSVTMILPVMIAFFVQIPLSIYYNKTYESQIKPQGQS